MVYLTPDTEVTVGEDAELPGSTVPSRFWVEEREEQATHLPHNRCKHPVLFVCGLVGVCAVLAVAAVTPRAQFLSDQLQRDQLSSVAPTQSATKDPAIREVSVSHTLARQRASHCMSPAVDSDGNRAATGSRRAATPSADNDGVHSSRQGPSTDSRPDAHHGDTFPHTCSHSCFNDVQTHPHLRTNDAGARLRISRLRERCCRRTAVSEQHRDLHAAAHQQPNGDTRTAAQGTSQPKPRSAAQVSRDAARDSRTVPQSAHRDCR